MMIDTAQGITRPRGFRAAGVTAGLKKSGKADLALVVNDGPAHQAAAVFTSNRFAAAPVIWSRSVMADGLLRGVVLNSGGANACTGPQGMIDAQAMASQLAKGLSCPIDQVAVASTGLIGEALAMDKVIAGIDLAVDQLTATGGQLAAEAIMTTDTVSKQASYVSPSGWSIGGMAKGAGMLAPALATMLVVLTSDVDLPAERLDEALRLACAESFDRADADGCMSTNDSVMLLANGASGVRPDDLEFLTALKLCCISLARQLIADAEGAEHAITVCVNHAASVDDALEVARCVARSNLFKCAIAGNDPNWGRVLAAIGTTEADFDPDQVSVAFNGQTVFADGRPGVDRHLVDLTDFAVAVDIDLDAGEQTGTIWTTDLTHGYVSENADYSS